MVVGSKIFLQLGSNSKSLGFWVLLSLAFLFYGCASHPNYHVGKALLKGQMPILPSAPDSLRAELELTAFSGGQRSSVSAAFMCKPRAKYKLDLFGLPGLVAASFFWQVEGWTLVIFDRSNFLKGEGEHVEFGNLGIHEISIHDSFAFLWGDFFPGISSLHQSALPTDFKSTPEGLEVWQYSTKGQVWKARLQVGTGLVESVTREDSAFRIEYSDYKIRAERTVPGKTRIFSRSGLLLEIQVKRLENNPRWRRDPFFIKVPKGFRQLEREPGYTP